MHNRSPRVTLAAAAAAGAVLALVPHVAAAQGGPLDPQCPPGSGALTPERITQDACQKSVDLFNLFGPQLGAAVAGGNGILGGGGTLGGLGRFSVGVRATGLRGSVPQFDQMTVRTSGAVPAERVATERQWVGFPVADAAVGLFAGVPLGVTRVGGVDVLVNAAYVPEIDADDLQVRTTGGSLKLGYGVRVGLLQESALLPGVAVSVMRRELPTVSLAAAIDDDSVGVRDLRLRTDSWRLTAGKRVLFFRVAAGVGQDRYDSRANVRGIVNETIGGLADVRFVSQEVRLAQKVTRTNYFANLTLIDLPFFKVVGEVGRTQGGSLRATYNDFGGRRPDAPYTYGSAGVRVGF